MCVYCVFLRIMPCCFLRYLPFVCHFGCICKSNLEQVEDLLAQVQLKVCVVGARHVVDEHQAVPLGLKAVEKTETWVFMFIYYTGQETTNLCRQVHIFSNTVARQHV